MPSKFFPYLIYAAAVVIIVGFLLPWATVAASVTGISKNVTSSLEDTPFASKVVGKISGAVDAIGEMGDISIKSTVRGYQVPILVNDKSSKVAISIAQMFFEQAEGKNNPDALSKTL